LVHSDLPKVVGSNELMRQIERIGPKLHIFGHSHIPMDMVIDDIRYVEWSLGNVRERSLQCKNVSNRGPLCVYRDGLIGDVQSTYWGNYYRENQRNPECGDLAPWVHSYWNRR
jgi:hypothetical protein